MSDTIKTITDYHHIYKDILNKMVHKKYYYMDPISYINIMFFEKDGVKKGNKIYWDEILLRAHFSATISIIRNEKWLEGISVSLQNNNYILFSSSLRGFLESVVDSYYSLLKTPGDIAANFKNIKLAIEGKLENHLDAQELEESLIHFQHAKKNEKNAPSFNHALSTAKYIKFFDKYSDTSAKYLYQTLCEVVHPASSSVNCFTSRIQEDENFEYSTTNHHLMNQTY